MHQNLPGLMDMDQDERVVWPRDSLFRYFELLEKLQYNLEERKQLQEFAGMPWMLGVKFIRAAYIYLGRQSMFTVVASQPLNFYLTPKKGKFSIWHITFWAYVLISSNLVRTWQLGFSGCYCLVTRLYLTLCDPMDHGIPQARILEWIAVPFSRIFPTQGLNLCVLCSCIGRQVLFHCATWESPW